jgi:hypothetical protein
MSKKELVASELDRIPDSMLDEVLDFVRYLNSKSASMRPETALLSEAALARDWLAPEEDQAWGTL